MGPNQAAVSTKSTPPLTPLPAPRQPAPASRDPPLHVPLALLCTPAGAVVGAMLESDGHLPVSDDGHADGVEVEIGPVGCISPVVGGGEHPAMLGHSGSATTFNPWLATNVQKLSAPIASEFLNVAPDTCPRSRSVARPLT